MGAGRPVEVAIVGGGIIGCAAAAFAAEAGARVTLYERAEVGAGASGRNMGAVQHPFDPILARLETGFPIPPHAATAAMARRAREAGAQLELGAAAVPAVVNGRAVGVVLEGLRPRAADLVLIAAGPWSPYLLDPSGRWQPMPSRLRSGCASRRSGSLIIAMATPWRC